MPAGRWRDPRQAPRVTAWRALVVDDEPNIRSTLSACLESLDCDVRDAADGDAALAAARAFSPDLVFLDLRLGETDGLAVLPELSEALPGANIVVMTAYASYATAVEAVKRGAADYLPKPFTPAQIRHVVDALAERRRGSPRTDDLAEGPEALFASRSPAMQSATELASRAAESDASILLRGESGTGKGLLARLIHDRSARAGALFVTVNCPTLTEELLTAELFGHVRGAFTGAVRDRAGLVERANGGTLFLDEVAEIPPALQAKLLRFAQDREFERVGESQTRRADVRLVTATNVDLDAEVEAGRFRLDLLYRLNVVEVTVPPLRARVEDILPLADHFLTFFARSTGRPRPTLTPEAKASLVAHPWPGNVRELRNEMERAVVLSRGGSVGREGLSPRIVASRAPAAAGERTLEQIEREHIERVLRATATQEEAARVLGIDPSTLWRKRKRYASDGGEG